MAVTVDGGAMPREAIRFSARGKAYRFDEMTDYGNRGNFGEKAQITVLKDGGWSVCPHAIDFAAWMRVSHLSFGPTTKGDRELQTAA